MFKGRLFASSSSGIWKPKNPHSLEYLKYLHNLLVKNSTVTEQNKGLLVEALRSIAEIMIWGDQNDATVFDFFLEKNMLSYFLEIMNQKCGSYICVQLLQTLNILFENIRHETSLYYLLSNNHVNSIITHRFDFSDEEIMAYYVSFLKTLSFKLNGNTVHFFFNEQTNDFPLYTEAIKFFNHSESMVRIAVRTLTLNVWRVDDDAMLRFIHDMTAAPYFSNLVWFIGNHINEMSNYVESGSEPQSLDKLDDLIAEHLDHIHYVNDILCLEIESLNQVLIDQLMQRLFMPYYVGSLAPHLLPTLPHVSKVMALFLLTQIFLIITHEPLVQQLLDLLVFGTGEKLQEAKLCEPPRADSEGGDNAPRVAAVVEETMNNHTDEEKLAMKVDSTQEDPQADSEDLDTRPLYKSFLSCLNASGTDHGAFFALTILYAIGRNEGIPKEFLEKMKLCDTVLSEKNPVCDRRVIAKLVKILRLSCDKGSQVRLITVDLCGLVLRQLVMSVDTGNYLQDQFYAQLVAAKEAIISQLVQYYRTEELFLDFFEQEYDEFQRQQIKVFLVSAEAALLLPPTSTPFSGVEFGKRLPCGPSEEARRVIRVYFIIRQLLLDFDGAMEMRLPLSNPDECVAVNDCLNLNNSDLLSCTVAHKNGSKVQRFLVADGLQLILVEPDAKRLGWGVVRLVGFLQDVELSGDKDDNRVLLITIYQPSAKRKPNSQTLLNAKFIFDDHIRCMAAKQRLSKGRQKARQYKMDLIADLLEIPPTLRQGGNTRNHPSPSPVGFRTLKGWNGKGPGCASLHASEGSSSSVLPPITKQPTIKSPLSRIRHSKEERNKKKVSPPPPPPDGIPMQTLSIASSDKSRSNGGATEADKQKKEEHTSQDSSPSSEETTSVQHFVPPAPTKGKGKQPPIHDI